MLKQKKKILVNFRIDETVWKEFKKITMEKHSDSSKQLRKMIETYIQYYKK